MPRRLISASRSEMRRLTPAELASSVRASEGRTILCQNYVGQRLLDGVTNTELDQAFGADMIFLNGYSMDPQAQMPGLEGEVWDDVAGEYRTVFYRVADLRRLVDVPLGVYLECGRADDAATATAHHAMVRPDRIASDENLRRLVAEEVDFVVLGGNPGTGTNIDDIIDATARAKAILGDSVLIMAGKWEDGVYDKVIGDPSAARPAREVVAALIDAGADVVCVPMAGSRQGITPAMVRDIVEYAHAYKDGALVMAFLDGSVEGADEATVRQCGLWSKTTGADIHAIGDAGFAGISVPEDIYQLSLTIKGRRLTWRRMAGSRR